MDNRDELTSTLQMELGQAKHCSDLMLLAALWRRWGPLALRKIIGDYAVAIYSGSSQKLWLGRSLASTRPLFYASGPEGVAFASLPTGLLSDPHFRRGLDLPRLAEGLADRLPDLDNRSLLEGIYRVLPNQLVTIDRSGSRSERIWNPDYATLKLGSAADYDEAYRDVLTTAVKCRLRSSSTVVAAQLSAGYDSNGVVSTAALVASDKRIVALTAAPRPDLSGPTFAGKLTDESSLAAQAAREYGVDHFTIRTTGNALAHLRDQAAIYQDPFRNALNSGWDRQVRQAASDLGACVMLTGDLGNLTLNAGGTYALADLIVRGEWSQWFRQARSALGTTSWRNVMLNSFDRWVPQSILEFLQRHVSGVESADDLVFLRSDWLRRIQHSSKAERPRTRDSYEDRFLLISEFDPGCVRKGQLAETGTEVRDPLTDRRVVQFSLSLPPEHLFSDGEASPLARTALRGQVPSSILGQRIRGHQSADWHERLEPSDVRTMIDEIRASETAHELIDFLKLEKAVEQWPRTGLDRGSVIRKYTSYLPMTLAAGYFMLEAERTLNQPV